eukprot:15483412-Alexandrium_andersonii.AAC.1
MPATKSDFYATKSHVKRAPTRVASDTNHPCSVVDAASLPCDTPCSMGSWESDTTCGVYCEHLR